MISWLWNRLNGWKRILTVVLLNIPFVTDNPLLVTAVKEAIESGTWQSMVNAGIHVLLALATGHGFYKKMAGEA